MKTRRLITLFLCAHSLLMHAAERYVSTTGNDNNAGSFAAPWRTLAKAAGSVSAGDVVYVRGGTYRERLVISASGSASAPIIFRNYPDEVPMIDRNGEVPTASTGSLVVISSRNHVTIQGFTIKNWRTSSASVLPVGIEVRGSSVGIRLLGNTIDHIEQNYNDQGADGHGIKVYGTSATAISDLIIDGNHLSNLRLGSSEALVVNGNVDGFRVTNNVVHDCNNIGIDMIGYEGVGPGANDRARNGVCAGNVVYRIDSRYNPAYGGNFTTGGGSASAGGIYVDGARDCILERNLVQECNFGIEVASEDTAGNATGIIVRNNLLRQNYGPGLIMGGYNSNRGTITNCQFLNNTLYLNGSAQIVFQYHVTTCTLRNNLIWTNSSSRPVFDQTSNESFSTSNTFSNNLYYASTGSPQFDFNGTAMSFSQWQTGAGAAISHGDSGSLIGNPKFEEAQPTLNTPSLGFKLLADSPALDAGLASFSPSSGERDLLDQPRLRGTRVDCGAVER